MSAQDTSKNAKDSKKVSKKQENGEEVENTVFEYMKKQNRPYSLIQIFDNLRGKIKKSLL